MQERTASKPATMTNQSLHGAAPSYLSVELKQSRLSHIDVHSNKTPVFGFSMAIVKLWENALGQQINELLGPRPSFMWLSA
jgi:hypothetical protein